MPRRIQGEVSVLEAITSYSDVSPTSFLVVCACVIAATDVGCAIALYGELHHWEIRPWWPLAILRNTWDSKVRMMQMVSFAVTFQKNCLGYAASLSVRPPLQPDSFCDPGPDARHEFKFEFQVLAANCLIERTRSCASRAPISSSAVEFRLGSSDEGFGVHGPILADAALPRTTVPGAFAFHHRTSGRV